MERDKREVRQVEVVKESPITSWHYGNLPPAYMPAAESGMIGQRCGNCSFFEANYCTKWEELVHLAFWCKAWQSLDPFAEMSPQEITEYDKQYLLELKKYESINFRPPEGVAKAAKRGLELRAEYNRGGTSVGVARARTLSNRTKVTPRTINRMVSYFARHEVDLDAPAAKRGNEGFPSAGYIAWLLWGGNAGRSWANKVRRQMVAEDERD